MAFTCSGVKVDLVFELSLFMAKLYVANMDKDRDILESILKSLSRSKVSAHILETTDLELALSKYAFDDTFGDDVRSLLCRFVKITEAEKKKTKSAEELKDNNLPVDTNQNLRERVDGLKAVRSDLKQRVTEHKKIGSTGENRTALKRKLEAAEEKPAKMQKTQEQEDEEQQRRIDQFFHDLHRDVEKSEAEILAEKLKRLPMTPSPDHAASLLDGLTARVLRMAEEKIGREMNRVDAIWWAMVRRDFGRLDRKWSCGVRDIYKGYVLIHEARQQRNRCQA